MSVFLNDENHGGSAGFYSLIMRKNGASKYGFLGRMYELADFQPPTSEFIARLRTTIDEAFGRSAQPAKAKVEEKPT